jgi:hypothetical protein
MLSMVNNPPQGRETLRQVVDLLEGDFRASDFPQVATAARECRSAEAATAEAELVAVCRRLAAALARQAGTLASEVQQASQKATQPSLETAPPAAPTPAPPAQPAPPPPPPPEVVPVEPAAPEPEVAPVEAAAPEPEAVAVPEVGEADMARVSVARTATERAAVKAALAAGQRFAEVGDGTFIDVASDRMWAIRVGPRGNFAGAQAYVAGCRLGGHSDWRLPNPGEVQRLLWQGGDEYLKAAGVLEAEGEPNPASALWTNQSSRRWFGMRQEVTVVNLTTGALESRSGSTRAVHVLATR